MQIGPVSSEDLEEIYKINCQVIHSPWTKEALNTEIQNWGKYSKSLKNTQGVVVGYVMVRDLIENREITSIAVAKSHQRQGWGEKLLKEIYVEAKNSKKIKGLLLEVSKVNEGAIALYTNLGFKITRVRPQYYRDGTDALEMTLNIT